VPGHQPERRSGHRIWPPLSTGFQRLGSDNADRRQVVSALLGANQGRETDAVNVNEVYAFLHSLVAWAREQPDLVAVALVGSYARGTAGPRSDVDLVLLLRDPAPYLANTSWVSQFGDPIRMAREDWGKVTSLRVFYADGLEVEYGLTDHSWGSDPRDEGDASVIRAGCAVLYERSNHLSRRVSRIVSSAAPPSATDAG
jgi:predicted nucleotidyltransferase